MTAAQKKAKDNFKKAIAYRKKCGCSLKEAFAHVYGKKVGAVKKKAAPKKKAVKKAAKKKIAKKAAPKKKAAVRNYGSHKDTASHNVKISVVSGIGKLHNDHISNYKQIISEIAKKEHDIEILKRIFPKLSPSDKIKVKSALKKEKAIIKEKKIHAREIKKHI